MDTLKGVAKSLIEERIKLYKEGKREKDVCDILL